MTGGRGVYTATFDRYEVVPGNITQTIIAAHKAEATAES
jgi:elongation factor G